MAVVFTFPSQSRQGTITSPTRAVPGTFNPLTGLVRISLTILAADAANAAKSISFRIERADGSALAGATWNGGAGASATPILTLTAKALANADVQASMSVPSAVTFGGTVEIT